jgi:hypothetical protein
MYKKLISGYALACILTLAAVHTARAQYVTTIHLRDGAPSPQVKQAIEKNGGALLTELNNAQGEKRNLKLGGIDMDKTAVSSLLLIWEVCPFRCDELQITERCLKTYFGGYQVRNIPVIMEPRKGERFEEDKYQEIVLNFDAAGKITSVCFALRQSQYAQIMRSNLEVTDLRRRAMVIEFVERFRTAYNRKDLPFLEDIFSDDALIITGTVHKRKTQDGYVVPNVDYVSQTKKQYLTKLAGIFKNNARINVVFEEIQVNRHRKEHDIYGVKLVQYWNTSSYSDKGYLFLLWDFADEANPKIHVRTWQPYDETPEDDVYGLDSFPVKK